jgi:DNA-binding GntR family transcriptional regulator
VERRDSRAAREAMGAHLRQVRADSLESAGGQEPEV